MNLNVKIGSLKFKNPVTVASGTFGYGEKYFSLKEIKQLGAIVPKTVTLRKREGNPPPRIIETASGMLNAIGIENPGIDVFIKEKLPPLRKAGVPIIISILGHTDREFIRMTEKLNIAKGVSAIELNLSCPNVQSKVLVAQDPKVTQRIVRKVKKISRIPVITKLSPNVTDITIIAKACEDAGADGISLINTLVGMAIDIEKRKPALGNITGGLSGPAIKPVALNMTYQVAKRVKIPIIGMGGIMTADDAIEFLLAGATMVAVGTSSFINPSAPAEILQGIKSYMKKYKINNVKKLVGSLNVK